MRINLVLSISTLLLVVFFCSCGSPIQDIGVHDVDLIEATEVDSIPEPEVFSKDSTELTEVVREETTESTVENSRSESKTNSDSKRKPATPDTKPIEPTEEVSKPDLDDYEFVLEVTEVIAANKTGAMTVWIGNPTYKPTTGDGIISESTIMPADIGQFAKITPLAPDFDVKPQKSGCIKIHPSGSSESFSLTPKKGTRGKMSVRAKIELFEGEDCTGTPIPKTTQILTVKVKVDPLSLLGQIFDIVWDNFIIFLGSLLGLLATIALFKIRKKAKIEEKKKD